MKIIKIAKASKTLWHISNEEFDSFDEEFAAQGVFWFSTNKEDLKNHGHGANIRSDQPVYLYEVTSTAKNPAGWNEYDKYGLGQLKDMKYDSVNLDDDVIIFYSKHIKIISREVVEKIANN